VLFFEKIEQLPNNSCFYGVWGDPNVDDLTSIGNLALRETVSNRPIENIFRKKAF